MTTSFLLVALVVPAAAVVSSAQEGAPTRTISVPQTLTRTTRLAVPAQVGVVKLGLPPTHIAFSWRGEEGTGVRFRPVDVEGRAGRWRRAPLNHDAERGDRRFTAVIAVDRPGALEWRPANRKRPMTAVTLDQMNTLDGPSERVVLTAEDTSAAAPGAPKIITRAQWGADESLKRTGGSCRRSFYRVQQLFVHHTAGSNAVSDPKATMRAIYWYHTARQGWCDLGYNFVMDRNGKIYEGRWARRYKPWEIHSSEDSRGRAVVGAHVSGFNSGSVGISLMGNFEKVPIPPVMRKSLARFLAWEVDRHNLRAKGRHLYRNPDTGKTRKLPYIAGHRDAGQTACPGRYVYSALPGIRRDVKAVIGAGKANTALTFPLAPADVEYGQPATLSGTLFDGNGSPVAGRTVDLWQKLSSERWAPFATAVTTTDGTFSYTLTPEENLSLVAVYDGDNAMWGSQSGTVKVKVRPIVSLIPEGASPGPDGVYSYPPGTTSVTLSGSVDPPHASRTVRVRVSRLLPDGTYAEVVVGEAALDPQGIYVYTFTGATSGTYSAQAWLPRHSDHAKGASEIVYFRIP